MKRTVVVLVHCGYWLVYLLLFSLILAVIGAQARRPLPPLLPPPSLLVLCVAPNLFAFYTSYFLLAPRFLARKRIPALVIFGAAVCAASAVAGALLSVLFFGFAQAIFHDAREFLSLAATLFAICALHGGAALVLRGFVSWYGELALKEELTRRNFETELALIKSQINPHFLFNTINNIDVLISKDPALASEYLNKLSGILRYMVYETRAERIPLARELDYVGKYVELQKIRTANPGYVNFEVKGDAHGLEVAPMLLFPFVENAFKHTEGAKQSGSVRINVSVENRRLVFECANTYRAAPEGGRGGGGLGDELIRRRLALTYPGSHSLEVEADGAVYRVKLTLDEN
ncbi:MAG: sensor histidine kinase [Acidobacteria bacterium]|nr:sensor histidine kinase [Acidobacteriota bacterium]